MKLYGKMAAITLAVAAILFAIAGTLAWWNGWAFVVAYVAVVWSLAGSVFGRSPELVEERKNAARTASAWDRILVVLQGVALPVAIVVAALDKRLAWSPPLPAVVPVVALLVLLLSSGLTLWAMRSNPFFSSHVRIQADRGHVVVSQGPYGHVRHPGYVGSVLFNLAVPILLGSLAAAWIGLAFLVLTVVRTALEDRTLQRDLDGYRDYAQQVRYRLIPLVW